MQQVLARLGLWLCGVVAVARELLQAGDRGVTVWGVLLEVSCGGVSGLGMSRSCDVHADISSALVQSAPCHVSVHPCTVHPSKQGACPTHHTLSSCPCKLSSALSIHPSIPHSSLSICPPHTLLLLSAVPSRRSAHPLTHPDLSVPPVPCPMSVCLSMPSVLSPPGHAPCSTCPCLLCSIPPVPTWTAPSVFSFPYSLLSVSPPVPLSILSVCPHAMPRPSCPCLCLEVGTRCA